MPPKRSKNANKKKNKNRNKNNQNRTKKGNGGSIATGVNSGKQKTSQYNTKGDIPEEWTGQKWHQGPKETLSTVYSAYKAATNRFVKYMMNQCPKSVFGQEHTANSLVPAADWMKETQHVIEDRSVLKDLRLAIVMRRRVAKSVYGGGDAGHLHFLRVLMYCWTILKDLPTPSVRRIAAVSRIFEKENRFAALTEEDDMEIDDDDEIFPSTPVPRPDPQPEALTLDELLNSDDRNDAILFLLTLDDLMKKISEQYQMVVQNHYGFKSQHCLPTAIVEPIMEAAVATNLTIQLVQQLETELMLQHSHLTSPYRLLATFVLPELTQELDSILRNHTAENVTEQDLKCFLGDCLECVYRNPSDPFNKKDTIVQECCAGWKVDSIGASKLEDFFVGLVRVARLEVPIGPEIKMNQQFQALYQSFGGSASHSWIQNMPFIGGGRAIHHTLRLLQAFGSVVYNTPEDRTIEPRHGFFGKYPWRPGQALRIAGDLDELLMTDILPSWVTMCRQGILKSDLPRQEELCPLFVVMKRYFKHPEKTTSWSTAFAIHALLTAILETDCIADTLWIHCESAFQNYFRQLDWAQTLTQDRPDLVESSNWQHNMRGIRFLENLGLPVFGKRALWNPLCAGSTLSYLTFFGNLEAGSFFLDCHAQLRMVLHLYHALIVNSILREGQIPFLDLLYKVFRNSKVIWEGGLPRKGEFVQRFWMCSGNSICEANEMKEEVKRFFGLAGNVRPDQFDSKAKRTRTMSILEPADFAKSYRRICKRDFHDVVDKYHTPEQRRSSRGTDQYLHAVRTNDTLDAMDSEQQLLSFNFVATGAILKLFLYSLGQILQWDPIMDSFSLGSDQLKRQMYVQLFAQRLLGSLDFADNPVKYEFRQVPLCETSSAFMETFFGQLDPAQMMWF